MPRRVGSVAVLFLLAACSGGGGGGAAGLQPGVTLDASWTLAVVVTSVAGPCGSTTVGPATTGPVTTQQVGNQIVLDLGGGQSTAGVLVGLTATFADTQTFGDTTITGEFTLTFTPDGRAFSGTGRSTAVSPNGTCVVLTQANAERLATVSLAADVPFVAAGAVTTAGSGPATAVTDVPAPALTVSADGHWLGLVAPVPFDAVLLTTTGPDDCWRLDVEGARTELLVESPPAVPLHGVQVRTAAGWSLPVRVAGSEVGR